ncbi:MAG: TDT family transporter [Slackia sp.]|nr:TDT family transporter [Slackia sp.]
MRDFLKKIPIPTGGVALGLAALGILLKPLSVAAYAICGICSFALVALLTARLISDFRGIRQDFENPVLASVSATFLMAIMQLSTYLAPIAYPAALAIWLCAILAHAALIVWFTLHHLRTFDLRNVYPTFFICYVGIVVASVGSPVFGLQALGFAIFRFGFAAYAVLLVIVTLRYVKHPVDEGAQPLFCIYAAPMSLSLAGYLAAAPSPHPVFACVLAVLAQLLLVVVLARLPYFLRLKFYPSYAAMTFPFVISATALDRTLSMLAASGIAYPAALHALVGVEIALACAMVGYVFARYLAEFARTAHGIAAENRRCRKLAAE